MTPTRLTIIAVLSALVAWLWSIAVAGRTRRSEYDDYLLSLDPDDAWDVGYWQGLHGERGYWPEYARTEYDDVPGVGRVWRASLEEASYWAGWHLGEDDRDNLSH